jgi:hypothetical protein
MRRDKPDTLGPNTYLVTWGGFFCNPAATRSYHVRQTARGGKISSGIQVPQRPPITPSIFIIMADPLSVAASAAGLTSLALQLLGGCIQGFILLSTAHSFGKDGPTIAFMLSLQEIQLTEWARRAGLLAGDGTPDPRLNRQAVENTLAQLKDLLLGAKTLKEKYGLSLIAQPLLEPSDEAALAEATGVSAPVVLAESRRQILTRAGMVPEPNIVKRLWWAAVDKSKLERLVGDVRNLVDELRKMLDPLRQDDLFNANTAIYAELIALNSRFDQLQSLATAFKGESLGGLASSAELKAVRSILEDDLALDQTPIVARQDWPKRRELLDSLKPLGKDQLKRFTPLRGNSATGIAEYDGQKVFVEKKVH